jgi:serine/threonine protein kinase
MAATSPPSRIKRYRLVSLISRTNNSLVYLTTKPGTAERLAIKLMHHAVMPRARMDNECHIHSMLKHPYIMPVQEFFDYQDFRAIVMPQAVGGSLFDFGCIQQPKNPVVVAKIAYRLFKAFEYLHVLHILHGDVKPSNIVLFTRDLDDPCPCLLDFGHTRNLSFREDCDCKLMTCVYSAPEVLALKPHSFSSDIFSLAITLFFVVSGQDALTLRNLEAMAKEAANLHLRFDGEIWDAYPPSFKHLLVEMTKSDRDKRLTVHECLEHAFFQDVLGSDWLETENNSGKFPTGQELLDMMRRVKEAALEEGQGDLT